MIKLTLNEVGKTQVQILNMLIVSE